MPHHDNGRASLGGLMLDDFPSVPLLTLMNEHALSLPERDRVAFLANTAAVRGREGGREGRREEGKRRHAAAVP